MNSIQTQFPPHAAALPTAEQREMPIMSMLRFPRTLPFQQTLAVEPLPISRLLTDEGIAELREVRRERENLVLGGDALTVFTDLLEAVWLIGTDEEPTASAIGRLMDAAKRAETVVDFVLVGKSLSPGQNPGA